jgi:hypothetical protein
MFVIFQTYKMQFLKMSIHLSASFDYVFTMVPNVQILHFWNIIHLGGLNQ